MSSGATTRPTLESTSERPERGHRSAKPASLSRAPDTDPKSLTRPAATCTAFSLRGGGRGPISKAKDRTGDRQAHDRAFRAPEPAPPPAQAPRRGIPCSPRNRASEPPARAGRFPVRQGRTGKWGAAGRRPRAIPCSAGNNREFGGAAAKAPRPSPRSRSRRPSPAPAACRRPARAPGCRRRAGGARWCRR